MSSAGTQLLEDWQRFVAARKALNRDEETSFDEERELLDEYIAATGVINDNYNVWWVSGECAVINDTIILAYEE